MAVVAIFVGVAATVALTVPTAAGARVHRLHHVWVFVMENHSFGQILGNPQAPFLNRMARRHQVATRFYAPSHPSLPNYLAMISGSVHGCTSNGCNGNYRGKTLAGQVSRHGLKWRAFIEALPHAGYTGRDSGNYTRHHNPFVYFRSIVRKPRQRARIVPFTKFRRSLRHPPNLSFIVPTDQHNMHSGSEDVADTWIRNQVLRVMRSRGYRHHGAIFITWDEASKGDSSGCCVEGVHGGHQPFIAIVHNGPAHVRLAKRRSAYSLLRTIEAGFRFTYLGHARQVKPLAKFF